MAPNALPGGLTPRHFLLMDRGLPVLSLCFCAHLYLADNYLLTPRVCRTPTLCDLVHVVFNLTK